MEKIQRKEERSFRFIRLSSFITLPIFSFRNNILYLSEGIFVFENTGILVTLSLNEV